MLKKRKQPKNWSTYNRAQINSGNIFGHGKDK
jgi:hypothetical protein